MTVTPEVVERQDGAGTEGIYPGVGRGVYTERTNREMGLLELPIPPEAIAVIRVVLPDITEHDARRVLQLVVPLLRDQLVDGIVRRVNALSAARAIGGYKRMDGRAWAAVIGLMKGSDHEA